MEFQIALMLYAIMTMGKTNWSLDKHENIKFSNSVWNSLYYVLRRICGSSFIFYVVCLKLMYTYFRRGWYDLAPDAWGTFILLKGLHKYKPKTDTSLVLAFSPKLHILILIQVNSNYLYFKLRFLAQKFGITFTVIYVPYKSEGLW